MIFTPLTWAKVTHVLQALHAKLLTFNWLACCFILCLNSPKKWRSVFQPDRYDQQEKQKENDAYKALQTQIKHQLRFDIWSIDNMDAGSIFLRFPTNTAKDILASLIDESA